MDCIPPWLSPTNQCSTNITTYNLTRKDIATIINSTFVKPKEEWKPTIMEDKCKNPCIKMTNKVSLKMDDSKGISKARLQFRFKKTVRVEKKIVVYTWFNFIVDVGSSLGLWLGLSALGITDLAIQAFLLTKQWLSVKLYQDSAMLSN